jgi:hypothetical protein
MQNSEFIFNLDLLLSKGTSSDREEERGNPNQMHLPLPSYGPVF